MRWEEPPPPPLPPPPRLGAFPPVLDPRPGAEPPRTAAEVPLRGGVLNDLLPADGAADRLPARGATLRGPLKILCSLRGTPVAIYPRERTAPIPAKVRPPKRAAGSIRNTLCCLISLKWLEMNTGRLL